jgi:hypothetical protein
MRHAGGLPDVEPCNRATDQHPQVSGLSDPVVRARIQHGPFKENDGFRLARVRFEHGSDAKNKDSNEGATGDQVIEVIPGR